MQTTCVGSKDNAKSNDSDHICVIRENTRLKNICPLLFDCLNGPELLQTIDRGRENIFVIKHCLRQIKRTSYVYSYVPKLHFRQRTVHNYIQNFQNKSVNSVLV